MSQKQNYSGSCLCGSIKFEVDTIEPNMGHCHCSMCRKFHGASYATYAEAKRQNFRWSQGEEFIKEYKAYNHSIRQFCGVCGSSLTFSSANNPDGVVEFSAGLLDSEIPNLPDAHIFTDFKANWTKIEDQLPQYKEGRKSERVK